MSLLRRSLWLVLLLGFAALAQAENLARMGVSAWPALPAAAEVRALAQVDGQALALGDRGSWRLAAGGTAWSPLAWQPAAPVLGAVSNARWAFVLAGADGTVQQVLRLQLNAGQVLTTALPPLPQPLHSWRAATTDDTLTLAGLNAQGQPQLLRLALRDARASWVQGSGWPGGGAPSALLAQSRALYMTLPGPGADLLWRWAEDQGWTAKPAIPGRVLAGAARPLGQAHSLFLVEPAAGAGPAWMTMHTITGAWNTLAAAPGAGASALTMPWGDGLAWAGSDGAVALALVQTDQQLLRWQDWLVIAIYMAAMLGIGLHFYLREKGGSTSDFFVGGRSIPFWAAGVSLYATNTSSISFIAIPAKAFETNWQYLTNNLVAVVGLIFVATWVVPLLRRLELMSVFSYLELRFHPAIRMIASALAIVMQIGSRMSVVLFLPALAISTITGLDVVWSICIMGGITIVYTALGGMKAVIWTDFVQVFVMFGGALLAIAYCVLSLDGGLSEFLDVAAAEDKTKLLDFSFDLTQATIWGFIFLVLFDVVLTFPKDQVLMQRVLSTKSDKEAGRSIWTFGLIMIPGGFMFYLIGTALYAFYQAHPERMNPLLSVDATFPLFIAAELPVGVTGLIIAGIFAAAMSTLSSIINSVATMASVDFHDRLVKNPTPRQSVVFAEVVTVLAGLVGIGAALVLARFDIRSLFDVSIELAGLLGGGFAGAYTLGMFTRRANSQGVAIGIGSAIVLTTVAWFFDLMHSYFYLGFSIMICIVVGYLASLFFPPPQRSLKGLTIYAEPAG